MIIAATAIAASALFVSVMNPYTLPVAVAIFIVSLVLAYYKHQAILEHERVEGREDDIVFSCQSVNASPR